MTGSVLVAYAPRFGFSQEVAETVAATLLQAGILADLQPMRAVRGLDEYAAVILGAPLYKSRWHKDALAFLGRYRSALAARPAAVFAVGPYQDEEEARDARGGLDQELVRFPWFTAESVAVFGANALGLHWKIIPALKRMPTGDRGDSPAVRSWADTLPEKLHLAAR